jgi:RNA polymerase sigma-70 factor (ECF subfamily)
METNDTQLVARVKEGDEGALEALVARHFAGVYDLVFRLVRDSALAEDITQESFVKMWKHLDSYDTNRNFKTWIFRIAHNTTIDWLRKRKHKVFSDFNTEEGDDFETTLVDDTPLPDELFEKKELAHTLEKALAKMSTSSRELLLLRLRENLTFEEVAEALDRPLNTIKSQYRRALILLKEYVLGEPF